MAEKLPQAPYVRALWLFGSAAQGRFDSAKSDLDFAVEHLPETTYGFDGDWFVLKESLEELFGRRVDLVDHPSIRSPYFQEEVDTTRVEVYTA